MAGNPLASLPGLPQRPSPARSSASETRLTQPGIEVARSRKLNPAPTAAFRINVVGHKVADDFVYSATSHSLNTAVGHDAIAGFVANSTFRDVVDFSSLNSCLTIAGLLKSSSVAADSIGWLYSGGKALIYAKDTSGALTTSSSSLMEITLSGVSSGLSASNFK